MHNVLCALSHITEVQTVHVRMHIKVQTLISKPYTPINYVMRYSDIILQFTFEECKIIYDSISHLSFVISIT